MSRAIARYLTRITALTAAATAVLALSAVPGVSAPTAEAASGETAAVAMYRLYNPNSGEHFYTANSQERETLRDAGWNYEGIGWQAPATSNIPVYRLYNRNAGDHHYTMNAAERDSLVRSGWNYEGIGWYSDPQQRIPLYRQYNPHAIAGAHNYTPNAAERDNLIHAGWHDEGIGWYGVGGASAAPAETQSNDGAYASVEGVMNLRGSGSGYQAKLVMSGGGSTVSFGIQYEQDIHYAYPQYPGNTVFLVENVMSHATQAGPAGKQYMYLRAASLSQDAKVRLSWYTDNTIRFFVNDQEIGRTKTTMSAPFIFAVEGSAARNGDTINATVRNVTVKAGNNAASYGTISGWNDRNDYFGLDGTVTKQGTVNNENGPFNTNGVPSYGVDVAINGRANIPGNGPDGKPWTWDTCFSAVDPTTNTTGHPLSAVINIAQKR
ncbi:hypothetical protein [Bifidobacterium callitrichos]|uniref:Peptidase n=1 Tax=Bifidobacterium callitrichos DSM 23973 TaxID=1437609 RepID=A0A087A0S0_9BIFI|nr:hypothetical protein [Bifidobacterium callitrichos]KFI52370.1 peptidase [Bifidobacterium callitrichos DSM 23973]